jgi:hypothetical protein
VTQQALARTGFQGLTIAVLGSNFIGYVAFDTLDEANRAA